MTRLGLMSLLLLCACGQQAGQETRDETPSGTGGAAAEAPVAALPDYLPDYPGSKRVEIHDMGVAGPNSPSRKNVAMETSASPEQVANFYRARFAEAEVPVRMDTTTKDGGLMAVGRDGERGAMLTISRIGDKTRIAVVRAKSGG
ncbi:MAG TPA: hypothetical protein VIT45_17090 [Allosphingosinicella sp.]